MDINSINWIPKDIVDKDIKEWQGVGLTVLPDRLVIAPGGYAEHTILKEDNGIVSSSSYIKFGVDLYEIDGISNYKNDIDINIKEIYKTDDAEFNKSRTRTLSITLDNAELWGEYYHSVYLMEMLGKPVLKLKIKIVNNTDINRSFKKFQGYASDDIGAEQFSQIQQESNLLYGTFIEPRIDDPINPAIGRIWLVTTLE